MIEKYPAKKSQQAERDQALERQNRRYAGLLDSLLEFDYALKSSISTDDLYKLIRDQFELITPYQAFALMLVQDDASFEVEYADYRQGTDAIQLNQLLDQLTDDGIFARAVRVQRPLLTHGPQSDTLLSALVINDEVRGMVLLHGCQEPDTRTVRVLQHIVEHASTALEKVLFADAPPVGQKSPSGQASGMYDRNAFDTLTGLLSREEWMTRIARQLHTGYGSDRFTAGILINLDGFWRLNQHFGDRLGSGIVKYVASRLRHAVHSRQVYDWLGVGEPNISIARTGRDEFALFISHLEETGGLDQVIPYLRKHLSEGFVFDNNSIYVTASIGISLYPMDATDTSMLIRHADIALKHAKQTGRDKYVYYSEEMQQLNVIGLGLEQALHRSLREGHFFFHYQPQVDVASGHICAMEAVLRMKGDDDGLISPAVFIPLSEHIGLAHKIGEWGLRAVCRQIKSWQIKSWQIKSWQIKSWQIKSWQIKSWQIKSWQIKSWQIKSWQQEGYSTVPVAVNLSAQQLNHPDLMETYTGILGEEGIATESIELEITETAISHDKDQAVKNILALHEAGFRLVLDDFGAGYSTLAFLSQFPVDGIKIDKLFINEMASNRRCSGIVVSLIEMARRLNISIIAEGVEDAEQLHKLDSIGCPLAQGYLIAKPMTSDEIAQLFLSDS